MTCKTCDGDGYILESPPHSVWPDTAPCPDRQRTSPDAGEAEAAPPSAERPGVGLPEVIQRVREWLSDYRYNERLDQEDGEVAKLDGMGEFNLADIEALLSSASPPHANGEVAAKPTEGSTFPPREALERAINLAILGRVMNLGTVRLIADAVIDLHKAWDKTLPGKSLVDTAMPDTAKIKVSFEGWIPPHSYIFADKSYENIGLPDAAARAFQDLFADRPEFMDAMSIEAVFCKEIAK